MLCPLRWYLLSLLVLISVWYSQFIFSRASIQSKWEVREHSYQRIIERKTDDWCDWIF